MDAAFVTATKELRKKFVSTATTQVTEENRKENTQADQTHIPDGDLQFDLKPLLSVIEDIINCGIPILSGNANVTRAQLAQVEAFNDTTFNMASDQLKMIRTIACEISCNCSDVHCNFSDVHTTTKAVVKKLSNYSWDAKLVIALASFAVNYSELCLTAQLYQTNPFANSVGLLKQLQSKLESTAQSWKTKFEILIKATLDLTKCIAELKQISPNYLALDTPPFSTANSYTSQAIYSVIWGIVICAKIISNEPESQTTEIIRELSSTASIVSNKYNELRNVLKLCNEYIEYEEFVEEFEKLQVNVDIVNALINTKDPLPLFHGSTRQQVSVEVLKGKEVLLLISDLYISDLALSNLVRFYKESRKDTAIQYEVVWVHLVEYSFSTKMTPAEKEKKFKDIQGSMLWYSLHDFSFVKTIAVKYIKKKWKFNKKSLFVKLSPRGGVGDIYSISKLWLWGSFIAPKIAPPAEVTWNINQLAGYLISSDMIKDGNYICLYGGEDREWIQRFTTKAKKVAQAANIQLEMVYVGQSNLEKVRKIREIIEASILSKTLSEEDIWLFWARLESMWQDNVEQGKTLKDDPITWELTRVLYCFDGSHQGWAVISEGLVNMAKARGDIIVKCLDQFDYWKVDLKDGSFVSALNGYIKKLLETHPCCTGKPYFRFSFFGFIMCISYGSICVSRV